MTTNNPEFKQAVRELVKVPYQRLAFRIDTWGILATFYFHGKASNVSIGEDDLQDEELMETIIHSIKSSSNLMVEKAESFFGKDWRNKIKVVNPPTQ